MNIFKSAEQNDSFGLFLYGYALLKQFSGIKQLELAIKSFQKSADLGNPFGMAWLGKTFEKGYNGAKSPIRAMHFYQKSADLNNSVGICNLGLAFLFNIAGTFPTNAIFAEKYLKKSADNGYAKGMFYYGITLILKKNNEEGGVQYIKKSYEVGYKRDIVKLLRIPEIKVDLNLTTKLKSLLSYQEE